MSLFNIFIPPFCLNCGRIGVSFCLACQNTLSHYSNQYPKQYALYTYGLLQSKLIKKVKYRGFPIVLKAILNNLLLADHLAIRQYLKKNQVEIITYVPLFEVDQRTRGFNQSKLIAEFLGTSFSLRVENCLLKVRKNQKQAMQKTPRARRENVCGVFTPNPSVTLKGKVIVLVDDVYTTGVTFNEARGVLLQMGVKTVLGFTLFRAG